MATGSPNFAINPNNGVGAVVSIGDSSIAPVSLANVLTAGAAGSNISRLVITGLGPTTLTTLRLFLHDGTNPHFYMAIPVPQYTPGVGVPPWTTTLEPVNTPNLFPIALKTGWSLRASINDTQLIQEANLSSICTAQTLGSAANLSLNGTAAVAASAAAISSLAVPSANVPLTLTNSPYVMANPCQVTLTSTGVDTGTYTLIGHDKSGASLSESITGPNNTTVYSTNVYQTVYAIIPGASPGSTNLSAGYSAFAGGPAIFPMPSKITLFSGGNLSAVNFTIVGILSNGTLATETLAGPNGGLVSSANVYSAITSIKSSASFTSNVSVGTPIILGGISILPGLAGDY